MAILEGAGISELQKHHASESESSRHTGEISSPAGQFTA